MRLRGRCKRPAARPNLCLRKGNDGLAFVTDGGHWIIDAKCQRIPDASRGLRLALNGIPGVVEHGLFIGLATKVILADPAGVRVDRAA